MKEVAIFCDGGAIGNPGPGGWGAVIFSDKKAHEIGGAERHTTNNRMEITAAIEALKRAKGSDHIEIKSDSEYLIKGITKWVQAWEDNGWRTSLKEPVLNQDLWKELMKISGGLDVIWQHVRGHTGVTLNERVDFIANSFARGKKPELFSGNEKEYKEFLSKAPKSSSQKGGKAYSYISMVGGKIMTHKTWAECEARVKEVQRARFKKAFSEEDEENIISEFKKESRK